MTQYMQEAGAMKQADEQRKALHRAYRLGQTYWQQADSESLRQQELSNKTQAMFDKLVEETVATILSPAAVQAWQPIETAPKDGTEILAWREDCGVLLARWTCWNDFATDKERDEIDEDSLFKEDWFYADFREGGRLEGGEVPTQWMPLPAEPAANEGTLTAGKQGGLDAAARERLSGGHIARPDGVQEVGRG